MIHLQGKGRGPRALLFPYHRGIEPSFQRRKKALRYGRTDSNSFQTPVPPCPYGRKHIVLPDSDGLKIPFSAPSYTDPREGTKDAGIP